jgi:hypothetical protein
MLFTFSTPRLNTGGTITDSISLPLSAAMKHLWAHLLFWIFIALYIADYFSYDFPPQQAFYYTLFELLLFNAEFYMNLFVLLPHVLLKRGKLAYGLSLLLLLTAACSIYFITGFYRDLLAPEPERALVSFTLNHLLFIVISFLVWYYHRFLTGQQKILELESEKLRMQMNLLKNRLRPHFLFNTMNNIYSLATEKHEKTPAMIAALSDLLSYSLHEGDREWAPLQSEIEMIRKYLQLQQLRFAGEDDRISFTVSAPADTQQVPPMVLLTLVENAIKHSDVFENPEGFVNLNINIAESEVEFSLSNSFEKKANRSQGIGLSTVRLQLQLHFGDNFRLTTRDHNAVYHLTLLFHAG